MDPNPAFILANSQSLIAAAPAGVISANCIDLDPVYDELMAGGLALAVRTEEAVTSDGPARVQFILETAMSAAFTPKTEIHLTGFLPVSELTAQKVHFEGALPGRALLRYGRLVVRVVGANTTAGTVSAALHRAS